MTKNIAYEKLTNNVRRDFKELKLDIDAMPDINPLSIVFCFLQDNFFNPNHIKDLYSRLNNLKSKIQSGLDYYEVPDIEPIAEVNTETATAVADRDDIEDGYFSILIDLLVDLDLLEKSLIQKDVKKILESLNTQQVKV
jgi:hypothetical protein